jgi:hypothetical protein
VNFSRINYDAGVTFVFKGKNNSRLYTIGIHPTGTVAECCSGSSYPCSRHGYHLSRLQASAQRKHGAGLLLGYYTPDGSVHTYDDGDEDAMFDRIAKLREYILEAVERDISTFREIDEPLKGMSRRQKGTSFSTILRSTILSRDAGAWTVSTVWAIPPILKVARG